jgi:hypothetical protein
MPAVAGIERRFSHQTVNAGFRAQPAVSIVADHFDGRALDTRDLAGALIDDFGFKAMRVGPLQVHAQQHGGPVLRLGAACTGLNIEEGIVGVHFAGEHALKFEPFDFRGRPAHVRLYLLGGRQVRLLRSQVDQLGGIVQTALEMIQPDDDLLKFGALLAQVLRALGVVPDARLLEFARYFL